MCQRKHRQNLGEFQQRSRDFLVFDSIRRWSMCNASFLDIVSCTWLLSLRNARLSNYKNGFRSFHCFVAFGAISTRLAINAPNLLIFIWLLIFKLKLMTHKDWNHMEKDERSKMHRSLALDLCLLRRKENLRLCSRKFLLRIDMLSILQCGDVFVVPQSPLGGSK